MKKDPNQRKGKFFKFRDISEWDDDARSNVHVPEIVRGHMVLVLENSDNRRGFVKIVTVISAQADDVDTDLFVPIAPSRENDRTDIQVNVANVRFDWSGRLLYLLEKLSYLRVDKVWEVPSDVLVPVFWDQSEHIALKQKSYDGLMHFMRNRPGNLLNVSAE